MSRTKKERNYSAKVYTSIVSENRRRQAHMRWANSIFNDFDRLERQQRYQQERKPMTKEEFREAALIEMEVKRS